VGADGINALPPSKSARPNISFKEMSIEHLNETVFYPQKAEWKPITLTLYDLKKNRHPVFEWIKKVYEVTENDVIWRPSGDDDFKRNVELELYGGCGEVLETWVYDNAWPQTVEFGELDMSSSDIVVCEVTLRYDRAYIKS
jgi:hypothetical protein